VDSKAHWESIYRDNSHASLSWFQAHPALSLAIIDELSIDADQPLIDIGGGASSLAAHLNQRGYHKLSVLDIAASALEQARAVAGHDAASIHWIEGDVLDFRPATRFAVWHDRAVFHFLTQADERTRYLASLDQALKSGGHAIIATFAHNGPGRCSGLDVVQYDANSLAAELGHAFELVTHRDETHVTPSGVEQAFAYFVFRKTRPTQEGGT
jgi:SAM-dependent methyltransferase